MILSGVIFGWAALLDGKNAIQTQSYGSAARGGACKCDVIVENTAIYELEPGELDILFSFSQLAYDKFKSSLKERGALFVDKDLVLNYDHSDKTFAIPATDIAFKEFKNKIIANMIMLGYFNGKIKMLKDSSLEESIAQYVPEKYKDANIEAYRMGVGLAKGEC